MPGTNKRYPDLGGAQKLSEIDLIALAKKSFSGSFLADKEKQVRLDQIEICVEDIQRSA